MQHGLNIEEEKFPSNFHSCMVPQCGLSSPALADMVRIMGILLIFCGDPLICQFSSWGTHIPSASREIKSIDNEGL